MTKSKVITCLIVIIIIIALFTPIVTAKYINAYKLSGKAEIAKPIFIISYDEESEISNVTKDGEYNFDGKNFKYKKGEPLLTYSRGGHDDSFIRNNVPLSVYTANSDGHTQDLFFRYNYPNEVYLPEVTVTTKKKAKK